MKTSGFLALSLDGYIAGTDGNLDFLESFQDNGEDAGYGEFFLSIDAILMGRKTFDVVREFPDWPYSPKLVYVYSGGKLEIPPHLEGKANPITGSPKEIVQQMKNFGFSHLYVDGGKTISSFLNENLLDELTLSIIPIIHGSGIPLFSGIQKQINLKLLKTRSFTSGIVQNHYKILH